MKVLVACEYSDTVSAAFRAEGHDVTSCDLLPSENPDAKHVIGDVRPLLRERWDLVIAHPPCNYLTLYTWTFRNHLRFANWWPRFWDGVNLFWDFLETSNTRVAVENPPRMNPPAARLIRPADQITDFAFFGDPVRKRVGWWLKGLPPLIATCHVHDARFLVRDRPGQWTRESVKPSQYGEVRSSRNRARFQPGIAAAMAQQWGSLV